MMSAMRNNTATILWILVFAFIATIIFSWGMGGFKGKYKPGVIGEVDGEPISNDLYDSNVESRLAAEREKSDKPLGENQSNQIRNEVWDGLVNNLLTQHERERAKLVTSDKEVAFSVRNFPPQQLLQNPNLRDSTGNFDFDYYNRILDDPSNMEFILQLEKNTRDQILMQKMIQRVTSGSHISEEEAKERYIRNNTLAHATAIVVDWKSQQVDTSSITQEEIEQYYRENHERFKRSEVRKVRYALFAADPSPADSSEALDIILEIKEKLDNGEDFAELAREYSDDSSAPQGGDLGWFGKGKMVEPFEKAALAAKLNTVVGPVESRFGLHLIKVEGRRGKGDDWELKARHILIKYETSPETWDDLQLRAKGFQEEASQNGFNTALEVYNIEPDTLKRLSKRGFFPGLGRNMAASDFMFNNPIHKVTPVYYFVRGYAVFEVFEIDPEHYQSIEEAHAAIIAGIQKDKQMEIAKKKRMKSIKLSLRRAILMKPPRRSASRSRHFRSHSRWMILSLALEETMNSPPGCSV